MANIATLNFDRSRQATQTIEFKSLIFSAAVAGKIRLKQAG